MSELIVPQDLANRIRKIHGQHRKRFTREQTSAWRVYDRDLSDHPALVDWYDGYAVLWTRTRTRDETEEQAETWRAGVRAAVAQGLDLPPEKVIHKERRDGRFQYSKLASAQVLHRVQEQGLQFEVNLSDYLDTGLFLDHRPLRARLGQEARGLRVLNLFCYTGAFTVHAACAGAARTLSVDLSRTYLDWAGRNLSNNGQRVGQEHTLERADVLPWLQAAASGNERFDRIVCDPPTFSNSKRTEATFAVDRDWPVLLRRSCALLAPGGILWFSTNYRGFRLDNTVLPAGMTVRDISAQTIPPDVRDQKIHVCFELERAR